MTNIIQFPTTKTTKARNMENLIDEIFEVGDMHSLSDFFGSLAVCMSQTMNLVFAQSNYDLGELERISDKLDDICQAFYACDKNILNKRINN